MEGQYYIHGLTTGYKSLSYQLNQDFSLVEAWVLLKPKHNSRVCHHAYLSCISSFAIPTSLINFTWLSLKACSLNTMGWNQSWSIKYIALFQYCLSTLDVLWCQPIKLISTSEFHEYWWNDIDFIFFCPLHLVQGLRSLKHRLLQKLSVTKNLDSSLRNRYFSALIFQEREFCDH